MCTNLKEFVFYFSEDLCGIFVKSVIEGSISDLSGSIMVNDQITEVNGTSLSGRSNQEAVDILKKTGKILSNPYTAKDKTL